LALSTCFVHAQNDRIHDTARRKTHKMFQEVQDRINTKSNNHRLRPWHPGQESEERVFSEAEFSILLQKVQKAQQKSDSKDFAKNLFIWLVFVLILMAVLNQYNHSKHAIPSRASVTGSISGNASRTVVSVPGSKGDDIAMKYGASAKRSADTAHPLLDTKANQ